MNVLTVLADPDVRAGTELSTNSSSAAIRRLGHRVCLMHNRSEVPAVASAYDSALGIPALFDGYALREPTGFRAALEAMDRFLKSESIDVIHLNSVPRLSAFAWLLSRAPTAVTVHIPPCPNGSRYLWSQRLPCNRKSGLVCLTQGYRRDGCGHMGNGQPIRLRGFLRGMYLNSQLVRLLARAPRVVAISRWMVERLGADGVAPDRIRLVSSPVLDDFTPVPPTEPEQPPAVLFVGRAVPFKGAGDLLRASANISTPHRIWIVGGGSQAEALRSHASRLGIADRVSFFGHLAPEAIADFRRRATVVVVPSLWNEAFGRVGVEAMAAGRPVVGYDVGGISDWLIDGVTGRLVPVGDVGALALAIDAILRDPDLGRRMGVAGSAAAAAWTADRHAQAMVPVLAEAREAFAAAQAVR